MAKAKAQEEGLKKGKAYFNLVGYAKVNDFTFTIDKESTNNDKYVYSRMNLGVDCGTSNVVYAEQMGGYMNDGSSKLYVHGKSADGKKDDFQNQIILDWDERDNPDVMKELGDQCFIKIGLEKDVKGKTVVERFLSEYDAIAYIQANLQSDMVISVSGNLKYSVYEGETQCKKEITSIYLSQAKPEEFKATFTQTFYLRKDYMGKPDVEKNSITAYGYVPEYFSKIDGKEVKKNLLVAKTFEFDLGRHPEKVVNQFNQMFLKFKNGYLLEMSINGEFREGVSTVATTFDDLDNDTKMLVQIGMITEEQALTQNAITGAREKRMIFVQPNRINVTNKNEDGSESVTQHIDINPEKYVENEVEFYADYSDEEESEQVANEDLTDSGTILDEKSLDFLNSLT